MYSCCTCTQYVVYMMYSCCTCTQYVVYSMYSCCTCTQYVVYRMYSCCTCTQYVVYTVQYVQLLHGCPSTAQLWAKRVEFKSQFKIQERAECAFKFYEIFLQETGGGGRVEQDGDTLRFYILYIHIMML